MIFRIVNDRAVIDMLFTLVSYSYGPLLGLYTFGLFTRRKARDRLTPLIAVLSPVICYFLSENSVLLLNGYRFGFELIFLNGFLTFAGLLAFSRTKAD
jgi:hypothetical protein